MVFITYWMTVLTFQDFFLFNPAEATEPMRQAALWLCLIGWLLAALGSPLAMMSASAGSLLALRLLPITALWWPASIIISQITLFVSDGRSYLDYLFQYPIFVVTDVALPILVLMKWSRMKQAVTEAGYLTATPNAAHMM